MTCQRAAYSWTPEWCPWRAYVETIGQFSALFSFNLRTPPSPATTPSGKRIFVLPFSEPQPDQLVRFLKNAWAAYANGSEG
jgi:hypothetical protein